jgi:excisionase family DNA binding protein
MEAYALTTTGERMAQVATGSKPVDMADGHPARLLRIEDISDHLACSRSMAWKLIASGQLRSVRIGRAVRVRPADLEAYIEGAVRET